MNEQRSEDRQLTWLRLEAEMAIKNRSKPIVSGRELLALVELAEAASEEHGRGDHEPECPLCVAVRKLEEL